MTTTDLSPTWQTAFRLLERHDRAEPAERRADGTWTQELSCISASPAAVIARLPGTWVQIHEALEDMLDGTGSAIDVETEQALWACDEERALFHYVDHWQAGLLGRIHVFPDDASYRRARFEAWQSRGAPEVEEDDAFEPPALDEGDDLPF